MNARGPLSVFGALSVVTGLVMMAGPVSAADPASSQVTVPTTPGESVVVEWTGVIPPGAENSSSCAENPTADTHTIDLGVPAGAYDDVIVSAVATIAPSGPTSDATDVIVTLVLPQGTTQSGDGGFVGVAESTTIADPVAGTYEVKACAFAGVAPQEYAGSFTLTAEARTPLTASSPCPAPSTSPKFTSEYIDTTRAGGEPFIVSHPDGQLLWGSHAGTTHFYAPAAPDDTTAAFVENYEGQTYYYISEDGEVWDFVPRIGPSESEVSPIAGIPATGFSDPEFAIDADGNVFVSEINLANVAVYKSADGGRTYGLQNVFSFTMSDRQWMAADRADELYMSASGFGGGSFGPHSGVAGATEHFIAKSTDGGVTWGEPLIIDPIVGDLQLDQTRGILYSLYESAGTLSIARFPNIREETTDFTVEVLPIAENLGMSGVQRLIDPTLALDGDGNLYATWSDNGSGVRPQGIYYAYSTDQGDSWSLPHRVDPDAKAAIWPWITVGEPGHVAIAWLQGSEVVEGELPGENGGEDVEWRVSVATTDSGLGCGGSDTAGFAVTNSTPEPVHTGTVCQHGTLCQTDGTDRRLGDYFSLVASSADASINVAVSDTRQGGAVALPLHVRQVGGPSLGQGPITAPAPEPSDTPTATSSPTATDTGGTPLADTGGGMLAVLGAGLMLVGVAGGRRRG